MPEYLFVFDIGTTGVKAAILTTGGELVGSEYLEYGVLQPQTGWVEQSVHALWQSQCLVSQKLVLNTGIALNKILAVAVSSQRATFVPIDRDEEPLMNYIGWQDQRGIRQTEKIKELIGEQRYYQISGLMVDTTAAVSKILWLKEHQPEIYHKTRYFASTQNVHLRQLGIRDAPCDLPNAAYLGLLDVDRLDWNQELLDALEIRSEKLPRLVPSGRLVGELSKEGAQSLGLLPGIPVVTAGGDLQVAGVGLGITKAGRASVGIGTGGGILTYLDSPVRHSGMGLNCLPHAAAGAWEMEGICLASGASYKWLRDTVFNKGRRSNDEIYDEMGNAASLVPPGAGGILVMPSLAGSGAPNWYPYSKGVILGISLDTDKGALARGFLEGICLEIRWMLEAITSSNIQLDELHIWGGGARSKIWNQIAVDIYGLPAIRMEVDDAGLVGAAICAGVGIGLFKDVQEGAAAMVHPLERYDPNPELHEFYTSRFELFKQTFNALKESGIYKNLPTQRFFYLN